MRKIKWVQNNEEDALDPTFDVYIGHTNFKISKLRDVPLLNKIDGVEILRVPSRYRIIVSIGKCFQWETIRKQIEEVLLCNIILNEVDEDILDKIEKKIKDLDKKNEYWCMYIFQNGKYVLNEFNNEDEYNKQLKFFVKCKKLSDGIVIYPKAKN